MGEENQSGDEGFVENATSEEAVSTPPAGDDTPTEAVGEQGAETSLDGDDAAEVQTYLSNKYGEKLSENDQKQVLRWREGNIKAKGLEADVTRLTEEAGTAKATSEALQNLAQLLPGGLKMLQDKGPEGFAEWANTGAQPSEPEPEPLDPNDPVQNQMLAMRAELDTLKEGWAKSDLSRRQSEVVDYIQRGARALKLPDDDKGTTETLVMRLAEVHLAMPGNAKNPQVPTQEEADTALREVGTLLTAYNKIVSGEAEKKIEEGKPKTPEVVAETETKPEAIMDSGDWEDMEKAEFVANARREGG